MIWLYAVNLQKIKEPETKPRRSKDEAQIDISKSEPIPEKRIKESENDESSRLVQTPKKSDTPSETEATKARKAKERYGVQDQSVSLKDAFRAFETG